jgi:signal transduction histidine kinase
MSRRYEWPAVAAFFAIASLGSILRCSLNLGVRSWGDVLPGLYCIPILIAAIKLGFRAALGVALASGLSHSVVSLFVCEDSWLGPVVQTILYLGVAMAAARLTRISDSLAAPSQGAQGPSAATLQYAYPGPQAQRQPAALGQILAALAHRFRTPVSSIEGAVELLDDRHCPEHKRQEFIRIIRKESRQLDRELCDVLDFVQPRKPQWRQVDVSLLLDEVIERLEPHRRANVRFRKEVPPDLPPLTCDPDQIGKMLLNLLMNSIQATPDGGQISLLAHAESDDVVISIKDNGRGIAPTIAGRIFDPFFTNRENALGLGLTVARQIVSSHCGNISVMESSDRGTCVSVRLPVTPPDPHEHRSYSGG